MYKKFPFISVIVFLLLELLKKLNILQGIYQDPYVILIATVIFSYIIYRFENHIESQANQQQINYDNLDIIRYVCAILVILLHMRPFLGYNAQLDLAFNNIISRVCVPFFFVSTGYFVSIKQQQNPNYIKLYIKKMMPMYLFWSILYIPMGIQLLETMKIPTVYYPFALLLGFLYVGTYYHLWYFPALFAGLWILQAWIKHFSLRSLIIVSFLLLCFGATETYYGMFPTWIQQLLSTYYFKIFYTTRNVLFFALFYITMGYAIGMKKNINLSYSFLKFILSCFLLVAEAIVLQLYDRLDSNILFSCVPLVYYLFISASHTKTLIPLPKHISLRELYKYYYLIHPIIISFVYLLVKYILVLKDHVWLMIFLVILFTHLGSLLLIYLESLLSKRKQAR